MPSKTTTRKPTKRPTRKKTPSRKFPSGMKVQSLVFDAQRYSPQQARSWASAHGFKAPKTERLATTIRLRQRPKNSFDERTFRTIHLRGGVQAVAAVPKSKTRKR